MTKNSSPRLFYGYIIVIASFLIIFVLHGSYSTYGVFFSHLQMEFNWSRTLVSGANSLAFFFDGLFAVIAGRLTDRFGPRVVMVIAALMVGVGYSLLSQIDTAWQLYFLYGAIVGMSMGSANVTLLSTTARWFVKRRGLMSGLVKVGTGTGMLVMPLVATWLIASYGWRDSYLILGIVSALSIVLVAQLLRRDPADKGLQPLGAPQLEPGSRGLAEMGLTLREATKTRQFWTICAVYFISWYVTRTIMVHIVPHALDMGFTAVQAASIISAIGGSSILGRVVMGAAADRVGTRRALVISFIIIAVAFSWLQLADELWALYLFAGVYGFAHGGFFALVSPLIAELMGIRAHGIILGMVLFISQIGGAIGSVLTGGIFDLTGSYQLAFQISLVLGIVGLGLASSLKPISIRAQSGSLKDSG